MKRRKKKKKGKNVSLEEHPLEIYTENSSKEEMFRFTNIFILFVGIAVEYIEGLELKRTMSTLVGFEIIEF